MKIDRSAFLALAATLAACPPSAPRESASASANPSPSVRPPEDVTIPPAPSAPDAGVARAPLATCASDEASVAQCVDFGVPGPTCEQGMSPTTDCQRLRGVLRPEAARAAVTCMLERRGLCDAHATGAGNDCFLGALSSACEQPGARDTCERIAKKCGPRVGMEECVAAVSAVVDATRPRLVSCITEGCTVDCFDTYDLRPAVLSKLVAKGGAPPAPPPRTAELARWPARAATVPVSWTECKLATDCTVVAIGGCGAVAVSRSFAPLVRQRVRLETNGKPDPHDRTRTCAGYGAPACAAGHCEHRR